MTKRRKLLVCSICCFFSVVAGLSGQTLHVMDVEGHTTSLTAAQISSMPHTTVKVLDHDVPAQFEGVSLASLISSVGVRLGDKLRGPRMTDVLMVEAADGYKVVFALAEIDPAFAVRGIILADVSSRCAGRQAGRTLGPSSHCIKTYCGSVIPGSWTSV